jgi:hypothetical protein
MSKAKETDLLISEIRTDGGTQPRECIDDAYAEQLSEAIAAGAELPPVDAFHDGEAYWLADGFHRLEGHKLYGCERIAAIVHQGTREDAQWFSYSANKGHDAAGLRRTNADKERAVRAALGHPKSAVMSDRAIAEWIGVSHMTVTRYRASTCNNVTPAPDARRTGRDGKSYPVSRPAPAITFGDAGETEPQAKATTTTQIVDTDTGEVLDNAAVMKTTTTPADTGRDRPHRLGRGVQLAHEAIAVLKRIPANDALRSDGLDIVARWCADNR